MSNGLSKEPFLSDTERLKHLLTVESELARLKADYDRTREIVDLLVEKFEGHTHYTNGSTLPNPDFPGEKNLVVWGTSKPIK